MAETATHVDPFARSPLADRVEDLAAVGATELPFLAKVNLRVDPALAARTPLPRPAGPSTTLPLPTTPNGTLDLPVAPNTWTLSGGREALWLGPDEWLLVAEPGSAPAILQELGSALERVHHSLLDVSADRTVVELAGAQRNDLLSRGCGLDLHPRSWRDGMCAQTLLAHIPILLQQRKRTTRIFVRPSFAGHLLDWLQVA